MIKVAKSFPRPCGHSENKTLEAENGAGIEELFDREAPREFYQHCLAKLNPRAGDDRIRRKYQEEILQR